MNDDPFRGILPRIELAKHYEHRVRDLEAALRMTDESLATLRRRTAAGGRHRRLGDEIRHRRARLLRRLGR